MYAAYNGQEENVKILLDAGIEARQVDLDEASFAPGSAGYQMLQEAIARKIPPPSPRTVRDVENLPRKEPLADLRYPADDYKFR
jgi:hypothetical protein